MTLVPCHYFGHLVEFWDGFYIFGKICAPLIYTDIKHLTCLCHMQLEEYAVMLG
jgi:hypothetical protein